MPKFVLFLSVRWRGTSNKIRRMLSHWFGWLLLGGVLVVVLRLCQLYVDVPDPVSQPLISQQTTLTALGLLMMAIPVVLGFRSVNHPPVVLAVGDLAIIDSGSLARPAVIAGLFSRALPPALTAFLSVPVVTSVSPLILPAPSTRAGAWFVLWEYGVWTTTATVLTSCVAHCIQHGGVWARTGWGALPTGLAVAMAIHAGTDYSEWLRAVGEITNELLHAVFMATTVFTPLTLSMVVVITRLAGRMMPTWAASLYQIAVILDLAGEHDASGAMAFAQKKRTRSATFPAFLAGAAAHPVRQYIEMTRQRALRGLLVQYSIVFSACWAAAHFIPDLWWLVFLGLGGFAASACAQDGVLRESRYPFSSFETTRFLVLCCWASLIPALRMYGFLAVALTAGALELDPSKRGVGFALAMGCALGWPFFSSAFSSLTAAIRMQEDHGPGERLMTGAVTLGGPIAYGIGMLPGRFLRPSLSAPMPFAVLLVASWAVLHLSRSIIAAPTHVQLILSPGDDEPGPLIHDHESDDRQEQQ
ncbi:hypothetical protein [uncultured Propionibacterium sp.]|uniref:hypothetical protein n=1 Tax=uncultured Propionibacterium sp. TaxID=218066 RepID=UPI002931EB3C|nr:hypothetical protein [uncultured Propionibacterium sp.]